MAVPETKAVIRSAWWLWVALGVVAMNCTAAGQADSFPGTIEMFTTMDRPSVGATGAGLDSMAPGVKIQVYRLDGIERVESELSGDLQGDPDSARQLALARIQQMDRQSRERLQRSALGLAKAAQYGIDRTPAVVFDAKAVVYGVADLRRAVDHYLDWRARALR